MVNNSKYFEKIRLMEEEVYGQGHRSSNKELNSREDINNYSDWLKEQIKDMANPPVFTDSLY